MSRTILLLNENRGFGGGEVHTLQVARILSRRGHRIHLGVRRRSWLGGQAREAGIPVHTLPLANEVDYLSVGLIGLLVWRLGADIVHCHATRDTVLAGQAHFLFPRTALIKSQHTFVKPRLSNVYHTAHTRGVDRLVCVSQALQAQAMQVLNLPPERCPVVYNGLDTELALAPRKIPSFLREGRWVGVVGSFLPVKGQRFLLQAAPRILERFPETRFLFAGQGPERESLEEQARDLGDQVRFLGLQSDPLDILAGLEVAVVPSLLETFSLVSLEAMALERPLVASRVGGIPEVVEDGVSGTLVPPEDP
ncbi:MAG: glycosyltransferase family 4 protein, partial [Burkholderiales bacterium]|nr:glycosyltransferase family 4 protein [Burkholderiales bacterium]